MTTADKAKAIVTIEKLRLIESELFRVRSKYGIETIDELDRLVEKGKISEEELGEDLYHMDYLLQEEKQLEKELKSLSIDKDNIWDSLQNLLGLPKLNLGV